MKMPKRPNKSEIKSRNDVIIYITVDIDGLKQDTCCYIPKKTFMDDIDGSIKHSCECIKASSDFLLNELNK